MQPPSEVHDLPRSTTLVSSTSCFTSATAEIWRPLLFIDYDPFTNCPNQHGPATPALYNPHITITITDTKTCVQSNTRRRSQFQYQTHSPPCCSFRSSLLIPTFLLRIEITMKLLKCLLRTQFRRSRHNNHIPLNWNRHHTHKPGLLRSLLPKHQRSHRKLEIALETATRSITRKYEYIFTRILTRGSKTWNTKYKSGAVELSIRLARASSRE